MASRGAYGKGYSRGYADAKAGVKGDHNIVATIVCGIITAALGFWFGKKK